MQFDPIPGIDHYRINRHGVVYDERSGDIIPSYGTERKFVHIGGSSIALDRLLLWTYVGRLELDIDDRRAYNHPGDILASDYTYRVRSFRACAMVRNQTLYMLDEKYPFITIPDFPSYAVSTEGVIVRMTDRGIVFKFHSYYTDYQLVQLATCDGGTFKTTVQRLVYQSWIGPIPENMQVDHIDNCRWHNHVSNLQLLTLRDNVRKGFMVARATAHTGWTDDQIRDICQMMVDGASNREIAQKYSVPFQTRNDVRNFTDFLGRIKRGICFTEIASKFDFSNVLPATNNPNTKLTREDVEKIWELCKQGKTSQSIADEFGCTAGTIDAIRWGRTWRKVTGLPPYRPGKGSTVVERIA